MIGGGALPESLAKHLANDGVECARAAKDKAVAVAQATTPDLVVLAGDAAHDRGTSVVTQLTKSNSFGGPIVVVCAAQLGVMNPPIMSRQVAILVPAGGVIQTAQRVRDVFDRVLADPQAQSRLQELVDAAVAAPTPAAIGGAGTNRPSSPGRFPKLGAAKSVTPGAPASLGPSKVEAASPPVAAAPAVVSATSPAKPVAAGKSSSDSTARLPVVKLKPAPETSARVPVVKPKLAVESTARLPAVQAAEVAPAKPVAPAKAEVVKSPEPAPVEPPVQAKPLVIESPAPAPIVPAATVEPVAEVKAKGGPPPLSKSRRSLEPEPAPVATEVAVEVPSVAPVAVSIESAPAPATTAVEFFLGKPPAAAPEPAPIPSEPVLEVSLGKPAVAPESLNLEVAVALESHRPPKAVDPKPTATRIEVQQTPTRIEVQQTPARIEVQTAPQTPSRKPRQVTGGYPLAPAAVPSQPAQRPQVSAAPQRRPVDPLAPVVSPVQQFPEVEIVKPRTRNRAPLMAAVTLLVVAAGAGFTFHTFQGKDAKAAPAVTAAGTLQLALGPSDTSSPEGVVASARGVFTSPASQPAKARPASAARPAVREEPVDPASAAQEKQHSALAEADKLVNEGVEYTKAERHGLAEAAYLKALQVVPDYPRAMTALVRVHIQRGDGLEAVRWASRMVKLQPARSQPLLLLGDAQAARGDLEAAKNAWSQAARYGSAPARERLAKMAE